MKKLMIMVSAIMMVATANAKSVETVPFEGVKVNVPARVRFVSGENYEMGVRSTDSIAAENVKWSVKDGVLSISSRYEVADNGQPVLCITIVSPKEPQFSVGSNLEARLLRESGEEKSEKTVLK